MSLKIEEVKAGDDVECIDIAEFSKIWRESRGYDINKMENISLLEIGPYYFRLKGKFLIGNMGFDEIRPSLDCLKYFKKKEQSQYTFDDLIDAAVKAFKDVKIFSFGVTDCAVGIRLLDKKEKLFTLMDVEGGIAFIRLLYKETFVIECADDIKRIKKNAMIKLENDNEVCAESDCINHGVNFINTTYGGCNFKLSFISLKGATVEQERGRDD